MRTVDGFLIKAGPYADGLPNPAAGQWLRSFDPDAMGGLGFAEWTAEIAAAKVFDSYHSALAEWVRQSTTRPLRADGKANRPLAAYSIYIVPGADALMEGKTHGHA